MTNIGWGYMGLFDGIFKSKVEKMKENRDSNGLAMLLHSPKYHSDAALALGSLGDERGLYALIKDLNDPDIKVKRVAASDLGKLGDKRAGDLLLLALKINDNLLRIEAATSLGKLNDERAVEPLIEMLKTPDTYQALRYVVIECLREFRDDRATQPLLEAIDYQDSYQTKLIFQALGWIGDKRAVEPCIKALNDREYMVRGSAAIALGEIGDQRAMKPLKDYLENSHKKEQEYPKEAEDYAREQEYAKESLDKINKLKESSNIEADVVDSSYANSNEEVLSNKDLNQVVNFLIYGTEGNREIIRAEEIIRDARNKEDVGALIRLLVYKKDLKRLAEARSYAAIALREIKDVRAVEPLIEALNDEYEYPRIRAAEALGEIGDERAIKPLLKLLDSPYMEEQIAAREALKKINNDY